MLHIFGELTVFSTETREFDGQDIRREYCPINGRYKLTYNVDDGLEDKIECPQPDSVLDNCPSGSAMNLRFRKCSFENHGKFTEFDLRDPVGQKSYKTKIFQRSHSNVWAIGRWVAESIWR